MTDRILSVDLFPERVDDRRDSLGRLISREAKGAILTVSFGGERRAILTSRERGQQARAEMAGMRDH